MSLHAMGAGFVGVPEMRIDGEEAAALSKALAGVASHYNVTADPKTVAWVNLAAACGMVYGPRFGAIRIRRAMQKKPAPKKQESAPASADLAGGIQSADAPVNSFTIPTLQ